MGLASEIQASFPRGVTLPNPLQRLCDYIDSKGPPVSRDFQLRPGEDEVLVYWFGGDAAAASRFAGFGAAGDGSIYAYWLGESSDICTAPVVFLAHGGGESLVLASSTEEFLSLLAIGYQDLGYDFRGEPPAPDKHVRYLRNWLADKLRVRTARSALAVVERANAQHPGFQQWLQAWSGKQAGE
jgi:hypothetical protein